MSNCSCKYSDAWKCASSRNDPRNIACTCQCHRKLYITSEWLKNKIETNDEENCEVGLIPGVPEDDPCRTCKYERAIDARFCLECDTNWPKDKEQFWKHKKNEV